METTEDDPNINYADYLQALEAQRPMPLIVTETALAFGSSFAAGGLYATETSFAVGALASGGYANKDGLGIVDISPSPDPSYAKYEKEKEFNDLCNDTAALLVEQGHGEELTLITEAIILGEKFTVTTTLFDAFIEAINRARGIEFDDEGNVIDSSLVVPEDELRVGETWNATFTCASANRNWIVGEEIDNQTTKGSNEWLTWTYHQTSYAEQNYHILENNITGAVLTLNDGYAASSWRKSMSRFYKLYDESDGSEFWMFGHAIKGNSTYRTVCVKQGIEWFEFSNSGTSLDGVRIVDSVWSSDDNSWIYTDEVGNTYTSSLDPLGIILSNTSADSGVGVITGNPNKPVDEPVVAPPITYVPNGDISVGIPITSINTFNITKATDISESVADDIVLDNPDSFTTFLGGFWDNITGLFDWLPIDFTNKLNGFMVALVACLVAFAAVKIVDIIWP